MRELRVMAAGVAVAGLLLAGCGDDDSDSAGTTDTTAAVDETTTTAAAEAGVTISDQWARSSAPTQANGAAYMNLVSTIDDALVGASVDPSIAAVVEIHETVPADEADEPMDGSMEGDTSTTGMMDDTTTTGMMDDSTDTTGMGGEMDGMAEGMVMQPIEELELPAGETVVLEPGGYHIMLLELVEPLVAGDTFELTLTFREAGEQTVTVEVRDM